MTRSTSCHSSGLSPLGWVRFASSAPDGSVPLGPWIPALKVPGASTAINEDDGTLSTDGLEMIFAAEDAADLNRKHLYAITRANAQTMTWTAPIRLSVNVTGTTDQTPRFTADDLTLYFASNTFTPLPVLDAK